MKRALSIHWRSASSSAAVTGALVPGGGILWLRMLRISMLLSEAPSMTTGPVMPPLKTESSVRRSRLAIGVPAPWQETHLAERMGSACFSNRVSSSSGSVFSAGFSDGAPASIHLRMVSIWISVSVSLKATGGMARVETFW